MDLTLNFVSRLEGLIVEIGGQAVFEGVMMRGQRYWVVAVRNPSNEILVKEEKIPDSIISNRLTRLPFIRGVFVFFSTIVLGWKALSFSLQVFEEEAPSEKEMYAAFFLALLIVIGVFILIPAGVSQYLAGSFSFLKNSILKNLLEGLIRLLLFMGYLLVISLLGDIKKVFQYHGAEHKSINSFEKEGKIDPEIASRFSRFHVSCGTSFIILSLVVMVVIYTFLESSNFLLGFLLRLALLPVVVGVSYEIIKIARRFRESWLVKLIAFPGIAMQYLTTREPEKSQIEVALASLSRLVELETQSA